MASRFRDLFRIGTGLSAGVGIHIAGNKGYLGHNQLLLKDVPNQHAPSIVDVFYSNIDRKSNFVFHQVNYNKFDNLPGSCIRKGVMSWSHYFWRPVEVVHVNKDGNRAILRVDDDRWWYPDNMTNRTA